MFLFTISASTREAQCVCQVSHLRSEGLEEKWSHSECCPLYKKGLFEQVHLGGRRVQTWSQGWTHSALDQNWLSGAPGALGFDGVEAHHEQF